MGDILGVVTTSLEALGELGEVARRLLGDLFGFDARAELLGGGEEGAKGRERLGWASAARSSRVTL
jgi:hypothetical protein